MPFEIFTADHNTTLSQVASLSRMNLRSPYTDAILADSDVPSHGHGHGHGHGMGMGMGRSQMTKPEVSHDTHCSL